LPLNRIVCLAKNKTWASEYVNDWIIAEHEDITQKEKTVDAINNYMRENEIQFDAIYTYDDLCTLLTSYLSEHYNLPGIPFELSAKIKDKHEFRTVSKSLGINHPSFFFIKANKREDHVKKVVANLASDFNNNVMMGVDSIGDNDNKKEYCKFPVIIKNTYGVGKGKVLSFLV
jgi:hypothetical protein